VPRGGRGTLSHAALALWVLLAVGGGAGSAGRRCLETNRRHLVVMHGPKSFARLLACSVLLLGLALAGCSTPVGRYLDRRGRDLGDCVHAEIGLGWPLGVLALPDAPPSYLLRPQLYVRAKATDYLVISDGYAQPVRVGWRGRYRHARPDVSIASGCPIVCPTHEETAGTTAHTRYCVLTERTYDGPEPGPGGRVAERFWLGINLTLLLSTELDLNLAELADFLVGWSGWDMLKDDGWRPVRPQGIRIQ